MTIDTVQHEIKALSDYTSHKNSEKCESPIRGKSGQNKKGFSNPINKFTEALLNNLQSLPATSFGD